MKRITTLLICSTILFALPLASALAKNKAPLEIGGFKLGSSVDQYEFTSYCNFLKQVVIQNIDGFRKGTIYYGTCDHPGEIVKIKLKYRDPSLAFYKQLIKKYTEAFGKPDAYIGDSFGIVKAWKWTFIDQKHNRILLRLQNNQKNQDESLGNTVKLELPEHIEAERSCFNKQCAMRQKGVKHPFSTAWDAESWSHMIPR